MATPGDIDPRVKVAVNKWARRYTTAPRDLAALITNVDAKDEIIERVTTFVMHREVVETHVPTRQTRSQSRRMEAFAVDPWAISLESLKTESEYVRQCNLCSASGSVTCGLCTGSGRTHCRHCKGSGKMRSAKTSNWINCSGCRGNGFQKCESCDGTRVVACGDCSGSGHVLAWLTYHQREKPFVDLSDPKSPIVVAHTALTEVRHLKLQDLAAFTVDRFETNAQSAVDQGKLDGFCAATARSHLSTVDRRLDRVTSQQAIRISVARRDVTYAFCGTSGSVTLSGTNLVPTPGPDAMRPMSRRVWMSLGIAAVMLTVAGLIRNAVVGGSTWYFLTARIVTGFLAVGVGTGSLLAAAGLLRGWSGGAGKNAKRKPSRFTLVTGGVSVALIIAIVIVGLVTRPALDEYQAALKAGDVSAARDVVEAVAAEGDTPEVADAKDRVKIAEAAKLTGEEKLAVLDAVVKRNGPAAKDAAVAGRRVRMDTIRSLVTAKKPPDALAALDKWFPVGRGDDPEAGEERAEAHELAAAACGTDPCRLAEAVAANAGLGTPTRAATVATDRARVIAALDPKTLDTKDQLAHLQAAKALADAGDETLRVFPNDAELAPKAKLASTTGTAERAKVPLLTSGLPIVEELLGAKTTVEKNIAQVQLDDIRVFVVLNGAQKCAGLYLVGDNATRSLEARAYTADRMLTMAFGRPVKLHEPTSHGDASSAAWYEAGGFPVVARWRDNVLVELRIGDATP